MGLFMIHHHDDGQGSHQTKGRLNAVVCVADHDLEGGEHGWNDGISQEVSQENRQLALNLGMRGFVA